MQTITLKLAQKDFGFEATDEAGTIIKLDTSPDHGGKNYGARPMQMLLMALGGCSGIDVISILKKQKVELRNYEMIIKGEREQGKEPALWKTVDVTFVIDANVTQEKAERAVQLSIDKYCSVAETLRLAGATITHKTIVKN
ncbi:MAG: OsmC family protein [Chitinophagaceae bacterium]